MIDPKEYPENYDWLSKEEQDAIVEELNFLRVKFDTVSEEHKMHMDKLNTILLATTKERLLGALDMLNIIGVKAKYGWSGSRNEYILVDRERAEAELDYQIQCSD